MARMCWVPLESNPEMMTNFLHGLGLSPEYKIVDVYGFSSDLIDMLPKPVYALILLYPVNKVSINAEEKTDAPKPPNDVYYMKQTIRNACGTIALLHSVANVADRVTFVKDSPLEQFLATTANMTPEERGIVVEKNAEIASVHDQEASGGQTEAPAADSNIEYHFISFVEKGGRIYELDGGKSGPIDHGPSSPETFAQDVAELCQKIVSQSQENDFSALAFVKE